MNWFQNVIDIFPVGGKRVSISTSYVQAIIPLCEKWLSSNNAIRPQSSRHPPYAVTLKLNRHPPIRKQRQLMNAPFLCVIPVVIDIQHILAIIHIEQLNEDPPSPTLIDERLADTKV